MSKFILPFILGGIILSAINCNSNPYSQGKVMYENFCMNCHMEDGTGLKGNIPPLVGSDYLINNRAKLACIIRYGLTSEITVNGKKYKTPMDGVPQLKEVEIANIINYINHEWGNQNGYTTIQQVMEQLKNCD